MAAAFLSELAGERFDVESAGLEPGQLNPLAVRAMQQAGIDISRNPTRSVFDLVERGRRFDVHQRTAQLTGRAAVTDCSWLMGSRRWSAWQKVMALAPLLLLALYLPGQLMLRCRMDGLLRPACCCPAENDAADSGPVVKAQDCCDRELASNNQRPLVAPARLSAGDLGWDRLMSLAVAAPALAAGLSFAEPDRPGRTSSRIWRAQAPPWSGPAMVLLKHAFLI